MSRYSRFFSLYNQAAKTEHFHFESHGDLVAEYTIGRTRSLRDLSPQELISIERIVQQLLDPKEDPSNRMRRKIIGILKERGAVLTDGRADMAHIYAWVLKYGYMHKPMNAYTANELPRLVTQAEQVVASDLKAIQSHVA